MRTRFIKTYDKSTIYINPDCVNCVLSDGNYIRIFIADEKKRGKFLSAGKPCRYAKTSSKLS